jgi:hypothetical protein
MSSPTSSRNPGCVVVLPVRDLAAGEKPLVRRARGRPRTVVTAPSVDESKYHEEMKAIRDKFIAADALLRLSATDTTSTTSDVIDLVIAGLAAEQAGLLHTRQAAQDAGKDASTISSRRVDALVKLAHLVIERAHLDPNLTEPQPAALAKLRRLFVGVVAGVAEEVLGAEATSVFLDHFEARLPGRLDDHGAGGR